MMISIRKLAAVDIAGLGPRLIIAEFVLGVAGPLGLGILTLLRSNSLAGRLFGAYLVCLAVNYVPLLLYAIRFTRQKSAWEEIADEPGDRTELHRKYRRVSLLLLLPVVVPLISLLEWRSERAARAAEGR
jgi:hypothetical protein